MKLSLSLPDGDVAFLDEYARRHDVESRSGAVQQAIRRLRESELGDEYEAAWREWYDSGDSEAWEAVAGDGLTS